MRAFALGLALAASLFLAACGFQLRGAYTLPYASLHIMMAESSEIGAGVRRAIRASGGTRLADRPEEAEGTLVQTLETRERIILALSATGRVREVRLRFRYAYRVVDRHGRELVPNTVLELNRDMTFDDSVVLSKEQEENLLWRDMQNDVVQQLMRRLAATRPAQLPPVDAAPAGR